VKTTADSAKKAAEAAKAESDRNRTAIAGVKTTAEAAKAEGDKSKAAIADVKKDVGTLAEDRGWLLALAGSGISKSSFLIGPFPTAEYDPDKKEFTKCAELRDEYKATLKSQYELAKAKGYVRKATVHAFADVRGFWDKKEQKYRSDSKELNTRCSTLRAEKIGELLKEFGYTEVAVNGHGTTKTFAIAGTTYDPNRRAVVILE
jgi:hypothetical protein